MRRELLLARCALHPLRYVIDSVSGEFIKAEPFARVNRANGFDEKGRPRINQGAFFRHRSRQHFSVGRRRAQLGSDVVQSRYRAVYVPTSTGGSWTFAAVENLTYVPGQNATATVRPMPAPRPNDLSMIGPEPLEGGRGALVA